MHSVIGSVGLQGMFEKHILGRNTLRAPIANIMYFEGLTMLMPASWRTTTCSAEKGQSTYCTGSMPLASPLARTTTATHAAWWKKFARLKTNTATDGRPCAITTVS